MFRSKQNGNLSAADRRFFALRESGWEGPIDQDGYPVTNGGDVSPWLAVLGGCSTPMDTSEWAVRAGPAWRLTRTDVGAWERFGLVARPAPTLTKPLLGGVGSVEL